MNFRHSAIHLSRCRSRRTRRRLFATSVRPSGPESGGIIFPSGDTSGSSVSIAVMAAYDSCLETQSLPWGWQHQRPRNASPKHPAGRSHSPITGSRELLVNRVLLGARRLTRTALDRSKEPNELALVRVAAAADFQSLKPRAVLASKAPPADN